jgi:3-hydroxybutyrate dehydrogenase
LLKGKSAIVTGATSGIGLAIVKAFAAQGCNLMFNGLGDPQVNENLRRNVADEFGVKVHYHDADLTRPEEISALIRAAEDAFGCLDILVNNAGIQHLSPIETFPTERWDAIVAINMSAPFHTIRAALPGMKRQGWGRIVNIASVNGLVASTHRAAYVASKHGIIGLTKVVTLEIAEFDITCNAICPGKVRTPLMETQIEARAAEHGLSIEAAAIAHVEEKHPSKQYVAQDEVAALAVYLYGENATSINGAALAVDGGWLAQ